MFATELATALARLTAGDDEQALEHLVAAWNLARAAELVPLIDTLAERVEAREEPIAGRTGNARYEAFMAVVARRRQADLGRLVAIVPRLAYGDDQTALDALLYDWPHTPRIATLLDRIAIGHRDRTDDLRNQHARPANITLDQHALALIDRLANQLARADESGDALLAQVYADPASDAPRAVYGDWLAARGDPRGEFIALQLARRTRAPDAAAVRRELALLAAHRDTWVGGLRSAVTTARFERGFVREVGLGTDDCDPDDPAWATIEAIAIDSDLVETTDIARFVAQLARLPSLREVRGLHHLAFTALAGSPRYIHLGFVTSYDATGTPELPSAWAPQLRSVGLPGDPADHYWLWRSGVTVERLEIDQREATPWLTYPLPPSITELATRGSSWHLRFIRDGGAFTRLEATGGFAGRVRYSLIDALRIAPEGSLRELRVVLPRRPPAKELADLERCARDVQPALTAFVVDESPAVRLLA